MEQVWLDSCKGQSGGGIMINTLNKSQIDFKLNKIRISNCKADIGPALRILGGSNIA